MPEVGSTWVTVLPDMRRFNSDLSSQAKKSGDTAGKSFGDTFAKAAAVGLAVFGAARIFGGFIADAQESAKISRLTENAIQATGGAANVTAKQVGDLSTSLSNKTAIDDELIQSGANLILTFKNIRNEAGAGNDIFDQTTEAALNLSAAGFGSVESASVMLGKALNDPLKGLTALGKAGVTFSEDQKEQIKTLTESGDLLGAQKIILDEIGGQVGGAAEAAADPIEKLKVTMGNLGEEIGTALLPAVESGVEGIMGMIDSFKTGESDGAGFVGFMQDVGVVARDVFDWIKVNVPPIWRDHVQPAMEAFGGFLTDTLIPAIQWAWDNVIVPAFTWLKDNIPAIWENYIKPALEGLWDFIQNYVVPAVMWLWQNVMVPAFTAIWEIVQTAWGIIGPVLDLLWDFIKNVLGPVFMWLWHEVLEPVWTGVENAISGAWTFIRPIFDAIGKAIGVLGDIFKSLPAIAAQVWYEIGSFFASGVNGVIDVINAFLNAVNDMAGVLSFGLADTFGLHLSYVATPARPGGPIGQGPGRLAFATGGVVPGVGTGDTVPAWLTPKEIIMRPEIAVPFSRFLLALNAGEPEAIQAAGGRNARGPQRFAAGGTVQGAQDWARANSGRPYIWGGVGPNGWDCSGWQSDIANFLLGTPMGVRRFATGSMMGGVNAGGYVRGTDSEYTIGVNTPGLVAAIGHTAGTLGGINVESGSGHGGIIGGNALGTDSGFAYKYYLPGVVDFAAEVTKLAGEYRNPTQGDVLGMVGHVGNLFIDAVPGIFDRGGILKSGDVAMNRSGRDELILSPSQTAAFLGGGGPLRIEGSVRLSPDGTLLEFVDARITVSDDGKRVARRAKQRTAR